MRREPLPAPWTEKRRPAVLARALPPCPRAGEGDLARTGRARCGPSSRARESFRLQEAGERHRKHPRKRGRMGPSAAERHAGSRRAALFDERSGGGGPGTRAGSFARTGRRGRDRACQRQPCSPLGRPKTPSQAACRSKLRSRSTVPSGARPSLRRGLRPGLAKAEGAPSSASSLLLLEGPLREASASGGVLPGASTQAQAGVRAEEIERSTRVPVVQVGLQRSVRRIVPASAEGGRKAVRGDAG